MTYLDMFKQFKHAFVSGYKDGIVKDFRPCVKPYFNVDIPEGVMVWLSNGDRLVYLPKEVEDEALTYAKMVYNVVQSHTINSITIKEDYICRLVGDSGLNALIKHGYLKQSETYNNDRTYRRCL